MPAMRAILSVPCMRPSPGGGDGRSETVPWPAIGEGEAGVVALIDVKRTAARSACHPE